VPFSVPRRVALAAAALTAAGLSLLAAPGAGAAPLRVQHLPVQAVMPVAPAPQPVTPPAGSYVALAHPGRLVARTVRAGSVTSVVAAKRGGLPASGVGAVVVQVTGSHAGAPGTLTAFSGRRGGTATVQFAPGAPSTDTAVVPLRSGRFRVAAAAPRGRVRLTVDVVGYYVSGTSSVPGGYHPVAQTRVLKNTPLAAGRTLRPVLAGRAGVPRRAGAVAVSVTATRVRAAGAVLGGSGSGLPTAAIAHTTKGRAVTAFAVLPLSAGRIGLRNRSTGSVSLAVDVLGYYAAGTPDASGTLGQLAATSVAARPVGARKTVTLQVGGRAGVPKARVTAVLATVHAVNPAKAGTLQAPGAAPLVTFAAHRAAADTALLPVSHGHVTIHNASPGRVTVQLDVRGYVPGNAVPVPTGTATARYLNTLVDQNTSGYKNRNAATMEQFGCDDATGGVTFTLLDVGVQSVTGPQLSAAKPGVLLALTAQTRLTYPDLRSAVQAYIAGYDSCNSGGTALRLAVGTNNDGVYSGAHGYAAAKRGADWAARLVAPLAAAATSDGVTVVGANDIEAQFAGTEAQAQAWENAYLAHTSQQLIYNGDANDCPSTFGVTGRSCAYGWTQKQYYQLAHRGSRIQVLPQIFFPAEAVKWANIDATGGGQLIFAGALTEHARATSQLTPQQGRAALFRALSSVLVTPSVPLAADLLADVKA
jgi:hypothetical protein